MKFNNRFSMAVLRHQAVLILAAMALFCLLLICAPNAQAAAGDISEYEMDGLTYYVEWDEEWGSGLVFFYCEYCTQGFGREFTGGEHRAEAEDMIADDILECGHCVECVAWYHCNDCEKCFENGDAESCPNSECMFCLDCHEDDYFCDICGTCRLERDTDDDLQISGHVVNLPNLHVLCVDCLEDMEKCAACGENIICIAGSYNVYDESGEDWCAECRLCNDCLSDFRACAEFGHCLNCGKCGSDVSVCDDCGWCEDCAPGQTHCPECNDCFGDDEIEWCVDGGEHCVHCDEAHDWICERCHSCMQMTGGQKCEECGLCEECCLELSEEADCIHGYCIESSEYWDHVCPGCGSCPQDEECEYCLMCEDCQAVYHCDHEICPENTDEWEEHLCESCGDCFNLDELCELCHMCESCNDHCRHDICPEDGDYEDHFCEQCGDCYEEDEFCDICGLCETCCADNTAYMGCEHEICIESDEFQDHYCFVDDQCLEYCSHMECDHNHVSASWSKNSNFHWHVCEDCGGPVDSDAHVAGKVVVEKPANPMTMTNGTSRVYCGVCGAYMETISTSYLDIKKDGSPYIVSQPKDYQGRISVQGSPRYATMRVIAGGENLRYQWYERMNGGSFQKISDDANGYYVGTNTNSLTVYAWETACHDKFEYFCLVSNDKGDVESRTAAINAQHVYDWVDTGYGTHIKTCIGDIFCGATRGEAKPHRFTDQVVVQPATTAQTGLLRKTCVDCQLVEETILPKLDPNHVHDYSIPHHNSEEHWWQCSCGKVSNRYAHNFGSWTVTRAATDMREGKRERHCQNCSATQIEIIDKLPHTHNFTALRDKSAQAYSLPNGYTDDTYHYRHCATEGCFGVHKELHSYDSWRILRSPYTENGVSYPGTAIRNCRVCGHGQMREFDGQWPILTEVFGDLTAEGYGGARIEGPTAANTGDTVTLTVTLAEGYIVSDTSSLHGWSLSEVTSTEGLTINGVWVSYMNRNIKNFSVNGTTYKATFTMPAGPVALGFFPVKCDHKGASTYADVVQPSCTVGGAHVMRCSRCGGIASTVSRIEPAGHVLAAAPIPGTEIVEYCSITKVNPGTGYTTAPNPVKYGYSGDFECTVCGEIVSGERTPQVHGREDKDHLVSHNPGQIMTGSTYMPEEGEKGCLIYPTCIKFGYTGDIYCAYCANRIQKGERIEPEGHDWSDWEVIREATRKQKGRSERSCNHCEITQVRDDGYSGPDYELKADKTRLHFDFTYGGEVQPRTITFKSVGRDEVTEITDYEFTEIDNMFDVYVDGLTVTLVPRQYAMIGYMSEGETEIFRLSDLREADGDLFLAPDIEITANIRKPAETYTLTVTDGKAYVDGESPLTARTAISARGGDIIHLVADQPEYFHYWSTNDEEADPSGLFDDYIYFMNRANDAHLVARMPPNNVKVEANYETMSDSFGNGLQWRFDPSDQSLTIFGTGQMPDYWVSGKEDTTPWANRKARIESIRIESGVTKIGQYAFYGCARVKSISIPDSVTAIGAYALTACPALREIQTGEGNTIYASRDGVLYNKAMTELITFPAGRGGDFTVPDGVTSIRSRAFLNAVKLSEVTFPASVTAIGAEAFLNCTSLIKAVILNPQAKIAQDGEDVFANTSPSLVIHGYAGSQAETYAKNGGITFSEILNGTCGEDVTWIVIGNSLTISGTGAMNDYAMGGAPWYGLRSRITNVIVEEGVTTIGNSAFYMLTNVTGVSLPDTLIRINEQGFYNCAKISEMLLPASVTYIGNQAFRYASALKLITIPGRQVIFSMKPFMDTYGLTICGYKGSTAESHASVNSLDFVSLERTSECGENVNYMWDHHTGLVTISGTGSMYDFDIGDSDWRDVADITKVVIEEGVTHIGAEAFYNCTGLKEVVIPAGITSIGMEAFRNCTALQTITFLGGAPSIEKKAFRNCVFTASIPGGDSTWTSARKQNYGGIVTWQARVPEPTFFLPAALTEIDDEAFSGINAVAVVIPANVTVIRGNPFAGSKVVYIFGSTDLVKDFAANYDYIFVQEE